MRRRASMRSVDVVAGMVVRVGRVAGPEDSSDEGEAGVVMERGEGLGWERRVEA